MKQLIFSLLLILFCIKAFAQNDSTAQWITYQDPEGRFTAQFPKLPRVHHDSSKIFTGQKATQIIYAKEHLFAAVFIEQIADTLSHQKREEIYEKFKAKMLAVNRKKIEFENSEFQGLSALTIQVTNQPDNDKIVVFLNEHRTAIYILVAGVRDKAPGKEAIEKKFIEGFKLLK